jgi:hypothetical protein
MMGEAVASGHLPVDRAPLAEFDVGLGVSDPEFRGCDKCVQQSKIRGIAVIRMENMGQGGFC